MKINRHLVILITAIIAVIIGVIFTVKNQSRYTGEGLWPGYTIETKTIDGRSMRLIVADTTERTSQGLMHVRKPVTEFDGMIFYFKEPQPLTFWNQNTFVDLTLYWMYEGKIIGKSELPSIERSKQIVTVDSPGPADAVVEFIK